MSRMSIVLVAVLAVAFVASVVYAEAEAIEAPKAATLEGKVLKAADDKGVVQVLPAGKTDEKDAVAVTTNDKTVVTLDGKEAKVADLKVGLAVVVTHVEKVASKIEAKTPEAPKKAE